MFGCEANGCGVGRSVRVSRYGRFPSLPRVNKAGSQPAEDMNVNFLLGTARNAQGRDSASEGEYVQHALYRHESGH